MEDAAQVDRSEGAERLKTFVSPYTGVVRHLYSSLRQPDGGRLASVLCDIGDVSVLNDEKHSDISAVGVHYDLEAASAAAVGEALERYAASFLPKSGLVMSSASELGSEAVAPERFALFSEQQYAERDFPFEPFTGETRLRWVKGWSIPDGRDAYLPQQLVYLAHSRVEGEASIAWATSNGNALYLTREDALLGGLLEAIERDAVMLAWYNRVSLPLLDWSSDSVLVERVRRHFGPTGLRYALVDMSAFCGVPVAFCILRSVSDNDPAPFLVSAAAAPTMHAACDKAMRECFQGRPWIRLRQWEDPERTFRPDFLDIETFEDHSLFYVQQENLVHVAFLDGSEEVRAIEDVPSLEGDGPAEWIEAIARRLEQRGMSAYAIDLTTPDLHEAGLYVMRAMCPELQQLDVSYRLRLLGGRRLYHGAYEAGLRDAPLSPADLNPYPHPFP